MVDYKEDIFPEKMVKAMRGYVEHHQPVGDFLTSVLCNDLRRTFACADDENKPLIEEYFKWARWEIPANAWGSRKAVQKWLEKGRETHN